MNFLILKTAVAKQFERMQKHPMFRVAIEKDDLWDTYLGSFPPGADPLYRERSEHNCNCCKQFIRAIGDCVAIIDNKVVSIWDVSTPEEPDYQYVAKAMGDLVKSKPLRDAFLHYEPKAGTDKSFEETTERTKTWNHFFVNIGRNFVAPKATIPTKLGDERATQEVFLRSLETITSDALQTVLDLIAQNSLYRGAEHKSTIEAFQAMKTKFNTLPTFQEKEMFAWTNYNGTFKSAARIKNTAIGTLLVDLSEGADLERAVKSFETKVAPANYKRPTALVTKAMIEKAKKTVEELGLTSALERRYATIHDISINNILFANRSAKKVINGDVFDDLASATTGRVSSKSLDKIEEVPIAKFISDILPRIDSLEVMFEGTHVSNLVSLIAPVDPTAGALFKWPNKFSWSYNGEMADAIKERVKKAGGNVEGDLCCRLAWSNYDDLDLHMDEPNGVEICFRNRKSPVTQGQLDVDMNGMDGRSREPVENIFYPDRKRMKEGFYHLFVHQFALREAKDFGFEAQIDFLGTVHHFAYPQKVANGAKITIARFRYTHTDGVIITESLPFSEGQATGKVVWGIPTQTFHKVNVLMRSPNYWDDKVVGNEHYFFMLENCANDGTARGFFNEFLKSDLDPHRKVLEMVGSKMKIDNASEQLSGLGFSSTSKNTLICRVKGSFTRTIKIVF